MTRRRVLEFLHFGLGVFWALCVWDTLAGAERFLNPREVGALSGVMFAWFVVFMMALAAVSFATCAMFRQDEQDDEQVQP